MTNDPGTGCRNKSSEREDRLQELIQGHSDSIPLAEEMSRIAAQGTDEDLAKAVAKIKQYNIDELEAHLQHEEQTILRPLFQNHPEHMDLCMAIGREHGVLRMLAKDMTPATARKDLAEFGRILKSHTLLENKELFPLVGELFNEEQLEAITGFAPTPTSVTTSFGSSAHQG